MTRYDWADRWVLVTGASAGMGKEFALQLAARGANIVLCSRSRQRLEAVAEQIPTQTRIICADLESSDGVSSLLGAVDALDVRVTHVVNNAGLGGAGHFKEQSGKRQAELVALNCVAVMRITRHFVPQFLEAGDGGFIQVASTAAFQPVPFMAVYGATKTFVLHMSVALAEELRGTGVRVMTFCPGAVPTEFQERAGYRLSGLQQKNGIAADVVVAIALRGYDSGKVVCTPGFMNRLQQFLQRFVGFGIKTRAAAYVMRKSGRDVVVS